MPNIPSLVVCFCTSIVLAFGETLSASSNTLKIESIIVDGKNVPWQNGRELKLGPFPTSVLITFGLKNDKTPDWIPTRLRYKLEGYDTDWRNGESDMAFSIRFYDESQNIAGQERFIVTGNSTGWNGSLKTSPFVHRRETFVVPPRVSTIMPVISSAGPPSAVGIYVIDNLVISRVSSNGYSEVLIRPLFGSTLEQAPNDWVRDGTRPFMAKVVEIGQRPPVKALGIFDDDPIGHAEWHNAIEESPRVCPGDLVVVEWNELFSVGVADTHKMEYRGLPPGSYRFCIQEQTIFGDPTGVETSMSICVAVPWWEQTWPWTTAASVLALALVAGVRYRVSFKLRREVLRLKHEKELEQQRLRIARDLHDDLGALLTGISLLSDRVKIHQGEPEQMTCHLQTISQRARLAVESLDGIVWAINPQNDTFDQLAGYLLQYVESFFRLTSIRCRIDVPGDVPCARLGTQERHHIFMAVKEACNNVARHSRASEVWVRLRVDDCVFCLSIEDNGCGFQPASKAGGCDGLRNMRERMREMGGHLELCSEPGKGTSVRLHAPLEKIKLKKCQ